MTARLTIQCKCYDCQGHGAKMVVIDGAEKLRIDTLGSEHGVELYREDAARLIEWLLTR